MDDLRQALAEDESAEAPVSVVGHSVALGRLCVSRVLSLGARAASRSRSTREPVEVTITKHPRVGHYDFMSTLPPTVQPSPGLDHPAFLRELAAAVVAQLG